MASEPNTVRIPTRILQLLLIAAGYKLRYGADGLAPEGGETATALADFTAKNVRPVPAPATAPTAPTSPAVPVPATGAVGNAAFRDITDLSKQSAAKLAILPVSAIRAFVWHHTGGKTTAQGTLGVLNQRGLSVQYAIDTDGRMWALSDYLETCWHAGRADKAPWSSILGGSAANAHTIGCEVSALDDKHVEQIQIDRAVAFAIELEARIPGIFHIGHGELSSQKQPTEGLTIARAIRGPDFRIKPELLARSAPAPSSPPVA